MFWRSAGMGGRVGVRETATARELAPPKRCHFLLSFASLQSSDIGGRVVGPHRRFQQIFAVLRT